jgi:hypothetical protein
MKKIGKIGGMKMKKILLGVAAAIIIPVIFIGLRKNSAPFFSVSEYQCIQTQDSFLSDDYFSSINSALANLCKERCAAHVIIDRLQQQFLALKKIVIAYRPSGMRVMISAHEPICNINNSHVLTQNNELFDKNVFAAGALVDIPEIMCHLPFDFSLTARGYPSTASDFAKASSDTAGRVEMKNISQLISHLLQTLPSHVYHAYNLELTNENIYFIDQQQPQFTILSCVTQEKLPQLLVKCAAIKSSIDEKKGFDKGTKWIADTRFAHYIVAYKA